LKQSEVIEKIWTNLPPCATEVPPEDDELLDTMETTDSLFGGNANGPGPLHTKNAL
jgi:hypothetical protein